MNTDRTGDMEMGMGGEDVCRRVMKAHCEKVIKWAIKAKVIMPLFVQREEKCKEEEQRKQEEENEELFAFVIDRDGGGGGGEEHGNDEMEEDEMDVPVRIDENGRQDTDAAAEAAEAVRVSAREEEVRIRRDEHDATPPTHERERTSGGEIGRRTADGDATMVMTMVRGDEQKEEEEEEEEGNIERARRVRESGMDEEEQQRERLMRPSRAAGGANNLDITTISQQHEQEQQHFSPIRTQKFSELWAPWFLDEPVPCPVCGTMLQNREVLLRHLINDKDCRIEFTMRCVEYLGPSADDASD